MLYLGAMLLFSIAMAVHVVRTGRPLYWLWLILVFQPLGGLVYLVAIVAPEVLGGAKAQRFAADTRRALDPGREYRDAQRAFEETPTVRNQSRLAAAAASLGRHDEAERLYREAAHGVHADDPVLLLGRANALLGLGRPDEALAVLDLVSAEERTASARLTYGRACDALGRTAEAERELKAAADELPGFEGLGRYAAFLARHGRQGEAREMVADMDRRIAKLSGPFRREARHWRDLAAKALAES